MAEQNSRARQAWLLLFGLLGLSVLLGYTFVGLLYLALAPYESSADTPLEELTPTETREYTETLPPDTPLPTETIETPVPSLVLTPTLLPTPSPRPLWEPTKPPYVFPTPIHIPPIPRPTPTRAR